MEIKVATLSYEDWMHGAHRLWNNICNSNTRRCRRYIPICSGDSFPLGTNMACNMFRMRYP
jgi:hypothetical protein